MKSCFVKVAQQAWRRRRKGIERPETSPIRCIVPNLECSYQKYLRRASPGVDGLSGVSGNLTDETLGHELVDGTAGERAVDLQTLGNDRGGDQLVGGDFLEELLIGGLIEEDQVVQLLLRLSLRPLLLGGS